MKIKFITNLKINDAVELQYTKLLRSLNDAYIFMHQGIPVLKNERDDYSRSTSGEKHKYYIPSFGKKAEIVRSTTQLKQIFDSHIDRGLFENALLASVSKTEAFLAEVLTSVLKLEPKRLLSETASENKDNGKMIPVARVLEAETLDMLVDEIISEKMHKLFYAAPTEYLLFLKKVTGIDTEKAAFKKYVEIKATRDLVVHNSGKVNATYIFKVGNLKRGELGDIIPINQEYFDDCITGIKSMVLEVKNGISKAFPKLKGKAA